MLLSWLKSFQCCVVLSEWCGVQCSVVIRCLVSTCSLVSWQPSMHLQANTILWMGLWYNCKIYHDNSWPHMVWLYDYFGCIALQCLLTTNKIGHSSRSSSNQRSKETAGQRCLLITISEKWTKDKQTDTHKEKNTKRKKQRRQKDKKIKKKKREKE